LLPQDLVLIEELLTVTHLDIIGCDLFWQVLGEDVGIVEQWGRRVVEAVCQSGKRSQLWLQNFNLDEQGEKLLEFSFTSILRAEPDEIACYYFWRNNTNPEKVWQRTQTLLRRIPRRQLYWQPTLSRISLEETGPKPHH
jgi:hypothetical protein